MFPRSAERVGEGLNPITLFGARAVRQSATWAYPECAR